jgi:ElaB/YqjD/DUF883 family membrane-anchored ribosome-binding protein
MQNEAIDKELNELKSDLSDLREDMASLLKTLRDAGIDQGQEAYERAYQRARRAGESVRTHADEAYSRIGREVEEHPLTSVLAAFGTGFVVGMLLDRRR